VVKLLSADPSWWNLSALQYHFFTQLYFPVVRLKVE
jgi:hypothetical protein